MKAWKQHRKCEHCGGEYLPVRREQEYCNPKCRRDAAYGRERFVAGTRGRRKRLLLPREASDRAILGAVEASETLPARVVAGSFRNGHFSSIKPVLYKPVSPPVLVYLGARMEQDQKWP